MNVSDGMNYAPKGKPQPVVKPGEFVFSVTRLDHGHIYGMCNALIEAGGTLKYVWDSQPERLKNFLKTYPQAKAARSEEQILQDKDTLLVAAAAVTSERGPLGLKVMDCGKDYFTDKAPFTTMAQLNAAKAKVRETGRKYMVYYSERLHVEGAILAGYLVDAGEIGRVVSVSGFGPHRLMPANRPQWFFEKESTAASCAISAAIRSSSTCTSPGRRTRRSPWRASAISPIPNTRSWTTTATA